MFKKHYTVSMFARCILLTQGLKALVKQAPPDGIIFQVVATGPQGKTTPVSTVKAFLLVLSGHFKRSAFSYLIAANNIN